MTSIQFTDADRDERGFVKVPLPPAESRSLADLLPTPERAAPVRLPLTRQEIVSAAIVVPLCIVALLYISSGRTVAPAALPATSVPTIAAVSPSPISHLSSPVMLLAYAAPDGARLGQIESTRAITPTAHYGDDWIQADVQGSGRVWLRASDWPALAIVGPDLAPRPTATALPYVPPPEPPPAPTQCAEVSVAGKEARSCGTEDLSVLQERAKQMWVEAFGGNIGTVSTPSPQIRSTP